MKKMWLYVNTKQKKKEYYHLIQFSTCYFQVYSIAQNRWIHCDPCENACDTPLMYEIGWNKKISYVIAYSAEEIQDVTWRYSCKHKEVMARRNKCSEKELLDAILKIREEKMKPLSEARRKYLIKRILFELVELMVEK